MEPAVVQYKVLRMFLNDHFLDHVDRNRSSNDCRTDAPVAPVRSSNTAMEHQNCCTDLRHPELLAACCPYSSVHGSLLCNTRPEPKNLENCRLCAVSVF